METMDLGELPVGVGQAVATDRLWSVCDVYRGAVHDHIGSEESSLPFSLAANLKRKRKGGGEGHGKKGFPTATVNDGVMYGHQSWRQPVCLSATDAQATCAVSV